MKLGNPNFVAYLFKIVISSWLTVTCLEWSFCLQFLFLWLVFIWSLFFSDIRIGTSFYFLVPFIWNLFPGLIWLEFCPLFPLGQCLFLKLGCVSCRLQIDFFLDPFIESMSFDWRTEAIDISRYYWNVHVNWDHYIVDFCFFCVLSGILSY